VIISLLAVDIIDQQARKPPIIPMFLTVQRRRHAIFPLLDLQPQVQYTLGVLHNLVSTKLALTIQTVNE
jgi:hypothetical protein